MVPVGRRLIGANGHFRWMITCSYEASRASAIRLSIEIVSSGGDGPLRDWSRACIAPRVPSPAQACSQTPLTLLRRLRRCSDGSVLPGSRPPVGLPFLGTVLHL